MSGATVGCPTRLFQSLFKLGFCFELFVGSMLGLHITSFHRQF
jgi:hypothetical protein